MGKHTYFELKGWRQSGRGLGATAKAEIQDLLLDIGADDCGSDCDPLDAFVMSFCHDSFSAYDNVKAILSGYAAMNEDVLLELEYECEEERDHQLIRFRGDEIEERDRVEMYPPFVRLTLPDENNSLPVLEFHFDCMDGSPEASVLVLLEGDLSADAVGKLEDSISSYAENVPAWTFEQLIHDVLSAENIGHWIVTPTHTFHI